MLCSVLVIIDQKENVMKNLNEKKYLMILYYKILIFFNPFFIHFRPFTSDKKIVKNVVLNY